MKSPSISIRQHSLIKLLPIHEDSRDLERWSTGINIGPLIHEITCRPTIIQHNRRIASEPNRDNRTLILIRPFLETIPRFRFRELQDVPNDWHGKWTRRHFPS